MLEVIDLIDRIFVHKRRTRKLTASVSVTGPGQFIRAINNQGLSLLLGEGLDIGCFTVAEINHICSKNLAEKLRDYMISVREKLIASKKRESLESTNARLVIINALFPAINTASTATNATSAATNATSAVENAVTETENAMALLAGEELAPLIPIIPIIPLRQPRPLLSIDATALTIPDLETYFADNPLVINIDDGEEIGLWHDTFVFNLLKERWNLSSPKIAFTELLGEQQTALASLAYDFDDLISSKSTFWDNAIYENWTGCIAILRAMLDPDNQAQRDDEADLLAIVTS